MLLVRWHPHHARQSVEEQQMALLRLQQRCVQGSTLLNSTRTEPWFMETRYYVIQSQNETNTTSLYTLRQPRQPLACVFSGPSLASTSSDNTKQTFDTSDTTDKELRPGLVYAASPLLESVVVAKLKQGVHRQTVRIEGFETTWTYSDTYQLSSPTVLHIRWGRIAVGGSGYKGVLIQLELDEHTLKGSLKEDPSSTKTEELLTLLREDLLPSSDFDPISMSMVCLDPLNDGPSHWIQFFRQEGIL